MEIRSWFNLPSELLPRIAKRLGIIELLSFRGVCKEWNFASLTASSIESLPNHHPWFLLYGDDNSQCRLLSELRQSYTIDIPEFSGATCHASIQGWILLQNGNGMFFFCPFSRVKIILPEFKQSGLSDHIATFSSQPTSQDCIVFINSRDKESKMVVNVIKRGENEWTQFIRYEDPHLLIRKIVGAVYHDEVLLLFDKMHLMITFPPAENKWNIFSVQRRLPREHLSSGHESLPSGHRSLLPFSLVDDFLELKEIKNVMGLGKYVLLSTRGTIMRRNDSLDVIIFKENDDEEKSEKKRLKGVWIYPRFFQISPNQSRSL